MQASDLRRSVLGAVMAVAAVFGPVGTIATPPAAALTKPAVTIGEGESFEVTYTTIGGNNPANQAHRPETCATSVYCDVIRLTIKPPQDPAAGYFVRIQMAWKTRAETDVPGLGEMTNNDMDMYVYQVPYDTTKDDNENTVASGASGAQPEVAYVAPAGDYDIVVVNFLGVNEEGYKLAFTYVTETDFTPFELLDDGVTPVIDTSGEPVPSAAAPALPSLGASPFIQPQIDLTPLTNFDDPFGLGRPIAGVSQAGDIFRRANEERAIAAAKPVSAATAIFWLVVFPLLLVGLAGAFFLRRRPTSLRLEA